MWVKLKIGELISFFCQIFVLICKMKVRKSFNPSLASFWNVFCNFFVCNQKCCIKLNSVEKWEIRLFEEGKKHYQQIDFLFFEDKERINTKSFSSSNLVRSPKGFKYAWILELQKMSTKFGHIHKIQVAKLSQDDVKNWR